MDEEDCRGERHGDGVPFHAARRRAQQDLHLGPERRKERGGQEGRLPEERGKEVIVQRHGSRDRDDQTVLLYEEKADPTDRHGEPEEGAGDRRHLPPGHDPSVGVTVRPRPLASPDTR